MSSMFAAQLIAELSKIDIPERDVRGAMKHPINYISAFRFVPTVNGVPIEDCSPGWGPPRVDLVPHDVSYPMEVFRHNGVFDPALAARIVRDGFNSALYIMALRVAEIAVEDVEYGTVSDPLFPSLMEKAARRVGWPGVCDLFLSPPSIGALLPELSRNGQWEAGWSEGCIGAYHCASTIRVRSNPHHQGDDFLVGEYGLFYRESPRPPVIEVIQGGEMVRVRHELGVGVGNPGAICRIVLPGVKKSPVPAPGRFILRDQGT